MARLAESAVKRTSSCGTGRGTSTGTQYASRRGSKVHPVRQDLGEFAVPLRALAGISFEPDRKGGRLRLRTGVCRVLRAADGRPKEASDAYQLVVEKDRTGVAEYLVDEVRSALLIEQVPDGPVDRFLLPGPALPVSGAAGTVRRRSTGRPCGSPGTGRPRSRSCPAARSPSRCHR